MSRHVLSRGRLDGIRTVDGTEPAEVCALLTIREADGTETDHVVSTDAARALAADGLLFADVELALVRPGADDLESRLAQAEAARDAHHLRGRLLATAILDVAAGRPLLDTQLGDVAGEELVSVLYDLAARLDHGAEVAKLTRLLAEAERRERDLRAEVARWRGAYADALAARVDHQPPHGAAADVERVVVAEAPLHGPVVTRGPFCHERADGSVEIGDAGREPTHLRLAQWRGTRVRLVAERVRGGQGAEGAREEHGGVAEQQGEAGDDGRAHGALSTAAAAAGEAP